MFIDGKIPFQNELKIKSKNKYDRWDNIKHGKILISNAYTDEWVMTNSKKVGTKIELLVKIHFKSHALKVWF